MRPRWHFMLKAALTLTGSAIVLLAVLYLASFIIFILRQTGIWFAPGFGPRGWYAFLVSLPWILIFAVLTFIVILEILVRRYAFTYRRPMLYSVLGILFFTLAGGFVVAQTSLHGKLFRYTEEKRPPLITPFYRGNFEPRIHRNIHRGRVMSVHGGGFMIRNRPGEVLGVDIASTTKLLPGPGFLEGDEVVIFGPKKAGKINAFGVRKMGPGMMK